MAAISTAAVYCLVQVGLTAVDQAMDNYQRMEQRKHAENREEHPLTQEELDNNPEWKETTDPRAIGKGHREYTNDKTGEKVRLDKGDPAKSGHQAKDHYHVYNPKSDKGDDDLYLDKNGNPCGKNSPASHLYPPPGYRWWF